MPSKNKKRIGLKKRIINYESPIRWGFFGLGVAISLFLVEISLSLLQIFLSFWGGDVVMATWVQILVAVMAVLTFLAGIILAVATVYIGLLWRKDTKDRITAVNEKTDAVEVVDKND